MTIDDAERFDPEAESGLRRRIASALGLGFLGAVALLAFELTAHPGLTVAIACSRAGWSDVRAGFWLRRADPERGRGKACSWFLWSLAAVKITAVSVPVLIALFAFSDILRAGPLLNGNGPNGNRLDDQARGAVFLLIYGYLGSVFLGWAGVVSALRHRVRVWVGRELRDAWRKASWPPNFRAPGLSSTPGENPLKPILLLTLLPLLFLAMAVSLSIANRFQPAQRPTSVVLIGAMGLMAAMTTVLYGAWTRALAANPTQCWPESFESPASPGDRTTRS